MSDRPPSAAAPLVEERRHLDRRRTRRDPVAVGPLVLVPLVGAVVAAMAVFIVRGMGSGDAIDDLQRRDLFLSLGALLVLVAAGLIVATSAALRRTDRAAAGAPACDRLTGLADRHGFVAATAGLFDGAVSVALIDIDRFRAVNEFLGHAAGDAVLRRTAEILVSVAGDDAVTGRFERDRFALAVRGDVGAVDVALARLMEGLAAVDVDGQTIDLAVRAGVSSTGEPVADVDGSAAVELLLGECEMALHRASQLGRGRVVHLDAATRTVWAWLSAGASGSGIDVGVRLQRSLVDRSIAGARVVATMAGTDEPIEGSELQVVADFAGRPFAVLDATLDAIARSTRTIPPAGLRVWFEVSARDVASPGGPAALWRRLSRVGLSGSPLGVELIDAGREDPVRLAAAVGELRARGVEVAVAATGPGAVTIGELARLPIDRVVVDASATEAVFLNDPATMAAVRAACGLAHERSLEVIAVGVESLGVAPVLVELGVDVAQVMITEAWAPPRPQLRDRR